MKHNNDYKIIKQSRFFDSDYYLRTYKDVHKANINPLEHFTTYGWKEGRKPSASFDTNYYLRIYPDIKRAKINPLVHYIQKGQYEARHVNTDHLPPRKSKSSFYLQLRKTKRTFLFLFSKLSYIKKLMPNPILAKERKLAHEKKITILTTSHTPFVAHLLQSSLENSQWKINIQLKENCKKKFGKYPYIVICPQAFPILPSFYIAFQMEQSTSTRWLDKKYFTILEKSFAIFDYSLRNIDFLSEHKLPIQKIFFIPILYFNDYTRYLKKNKWWDGKLNVETSDVLFYGDPTSPRRIKFLTELKKHFNIRIISEVYGNALYRELKSTKIIVNIHYYENALLETTRIYECLSLEIPIISESSIDIDEHINLQQCVKFTPIDDVEAMISAIKASLLEANTLNKQKNLISETLSKGESFNFFVDRFLLFQNALHFSSMHKYFTSMAKIPENNTICLSLPEFSSRRKNFISDNIYNIAIFNGLRHSAGWIGCGLSYKYLMQAAIKEDREYLIICEDDVEFLEDSWPKLLQILDYLSKTNKKWHIFSGLIADLSEETKVLHIDKTGDNEFIYINSMTSTVFNIYHKSVFKIIASWDETNLDIHANTIDRFIESQCNIVTVTTLPFLVGHKEELDSTLWGFNNTQYNDLISNSAARLSEKVLQYKEKLN